MTITLRNTKGTPLTFNELDGNFTDLESQIEGLPDSAQVLGLIDENALDSGRATRLIDSAYVNARVDATNFLDSAEALVLIDENALDSGRATRLIDSAYVRLRQRAATDSAATITLIDEHALDSSRATALINAAYIQARQDKAYSSLTGTPTIPVVDTDFVDSARVIRLISNEALDSDLTIALVDSAYVQLRDRFQDSSLVTSTVDATYIQARQKLLDSSLTTQLIDSAYVQLKSIGSTNQGGVTLGDGASDWTITVDGSNNLVFSYGGTAVAKIASNGHITSVNDVSAFGSI